MVRPYAVLKLDKRILDVIAYAGHVVQSMSSASLFLSPNPPLAAVQADIDALTRAQSRVLSRTRGATQTRDAALAAVRLESPAPSLVRPDAGEQPGRHSGRGAHRQRRLLRQEAGGPPQMARRGCCRSSVGEHSAHGSLRGETRRVFMAIRSPRRAVDAASGDGAGQYAARRAHSGERVPLSSESAYPDNDW